eukprot:6203873-Pleurochrysis_carterae.AAC.8
MRMERRRNCIEAKYDRVGWRPVSDLLHEEIGRSKNYISQHVLHTALLRHVLYNTAAVTAMFTRVSYDHKPPCTMLAE